jgi:hypothetical protein
MRTTQWILVLSVLMFVTSIWFILAGASGPGTASGPVVEPVATVKQIMSGIVAPASTTVYESVSIIVSFEGVQENHPRTQAEWDQVAGSAAAIAEAGGLMMVEGRARDTDRWIAMSQAMIDASLISMQAAQDQDKDALLASGEALNESCDSCHRAYSIDQ